MKISNSSNRRLATIFAGTVLASAVCPAGQLVAVTGAGPEKAPAELWDPARVDSHAPIGVMGDHTHEKGEFMLSYRYMYMPMEQNYDGDTKISDRRILAPDGKGYMVVPTSMDMQMHMLGLMYAPLDELTLMLMTPFTFNSMHHLRRDGQRFTTESEGWGDISLTGLYKIYDGNRQRVHLNLGASAPTGGINEEDFIPGPGVTQLPYPMQIGSGTWDLKLGITYLGQSDRLSWGAQVMGYLPLGDNDNGYSKGNAITATGWVAHPLNDWASASLRLTGTSWGNYDGSDLKLKVPAGAVQTADPALRGGGRLDLGLGLNVKTPWRGQRLAFEATLPIYQNLDGPQLATEWFLSAGWQLAF